MQPIAKKILIEKLLTLFSIPELDMSDNY